MLNPISHNAKAQPLMSARHLVLTCAVLLLVALTFPTMALANDSENGLCDPADRRGLQIDTLAAQSLTLQSDDDPIASGEIDTCTWIIDSDGTLTISPTSGESGSMAFTYLSMPLPSGGYFSYTAPWRPYAEDIKSVDIEGSVSLHGDLCSMFSGCNNLAEVDLAGMDTSQLTAFSHMFDGCSNLTTLDLSMLDASSALSTSGMFQNCEKLEAVKLPDFSETKLETMTAMFGNCKALQQIDLSNIDTSNVAYAEILFADCNSLEKVMVGEKWDLYLHEDSDGYDECHNMFSCCFALAGAYGTAFTTMLDPNRTYARIDTPEAPGYLWPADNQGDPGASDNPGTGDNPDAGDDPGASDNPGAGDDPSAGNNPKPDDDPNTNNNGETMPGNSNASNSANKNGASSSPAAQGKLIITLSNETFAFNGKTRTPSVTVKLGSKTLKPNRDYSIAYSKGRKAIGSYKVTVIGKGSYKFRTTKRFTIAPKTPALKTLKAHKNSDGSSGFIATWRKASKGAFGYEIRWSPKKSFKPSKSFSFKGSTPYAKKCAAAIRVQTRTWLGKTINVEIRAFKIAKGKKYHSKWSKVKQVSLKK